MSGSSYEGDESVIPNTVEPSTDVGSGYDEASKMAKLNDARSGGWRVFDSLSESPKPVGTSCKNNLNTKSNYNGGFAYSSGVQVSILLTTIIAQVFIPVLPPPSTLSER